MIDTAAIKALGVVRVLADVAGVQWKREGAWHLAICPFHDDSRPSFKVGSKAPHRGRCFSCSAHGDVIELAARFWDVPAADAMRRLAERYDISSRSHSELTDATRSGAVRNESQPGPTPVPSHHMQIYADAMLRASLGGTRIALGPARDYLARRGVLDAAHAAQVDTVDGRLPLVVALNPAELASWYADMSARDPALWREAKGSVLHRVSKVGTISVVLFGTLTLAGGALAGIHVGIIDPPDGAPRYLQIGGAPRPWRAANKFAGGDVAICEGAIDALSWHAAGVQAMGLHGLQTWRPWFAQVLPGDARPIVALDRDDAGRAATPGIVADLSTAAQPARAIDLDVDGPVDANDALRAGGPDLLRAILSTAHELGEPSTSTSTSPTPRPSPALTRSEGEGRPAKPDFGRDLDVAGFVVDVRAWERLPDLIEWAHWSYGGRKGETLMRSAVVHPSHRLTDLVIRWIELEGGGTFLRDAKGGAWLYADGQLHRIDTKHASWRGWLYDVGRINLADREGKVIAAALEQYAQGQAHAPEPRPWLWCDRAAATVAMHLHDEGDRIAVTHAGGVELMRNGGDLLLLRDALTQPIAWPATPSASWALSAIRSLIVHSLATSDAERSLIVSWAISALLRQRLDARCILFAGGSAGAGKTEGAKLITTLLHGTPRVLQATTAALWVEGEEQPIVALDNQESAQLQESSLQQWLLVAATGGQRKKREEGTSSGLVNQRTDALVMVTAIEPPGLDELIQRTVSVTFRHELHAAGYSSSGTIAELQRHRGAILAGLLELVARRILPRLGELAGYVAQVPPGHPKRRLADHLALCALIADACAAELPGIWRSGELELQAWLELQAESAGELARGTDVLLDAFERLIWFWNRLKVDKGPSSFVYRVATEDALFRCAPLYRKADELTLTESDATTKLSNKAFGRVVGVQGSYGDLHADLLRACKDTGGGDGFRRRVGSAAVLAARWRHNRAMEEAGWQAEFVRRSGAAGRIYRWVAPADDTQ